MACGTALARSCPSCGSESPAGARFCVVCGNSLDQVPGTDAPLPAASRVEVAEPEERRLVTMLFADLCGYTAVAELLDHETVKALTDRCLTRLAEEVGRYGGRVDKFIGDNVMAPKRESRRPASVLPRVLRASRGVV